MKFRIIKRKDGRFYPERLSLFFWWRPAIYFAALMCEVPASYATEDEARADLRKVCSSAKDEIVWEGTDVKAA